MPAYTATQKDAIDKFVDLTGCQRSVASKVCALLGSCSRLRVMFSVTLFILSLGLTSEYSSSGRLDGTLSVPSMGKSHFQFLWRGLVSSGRYRQGDFGQHPEMDSFDSFAGVLSAQLGFAMIYPVSLHFWCMAFSSLPSITLNTFHPVPPSARSLLVPITT